MARRSDGASQPATVGITERSPRRSIGGQAETVRGSEFDRQQLNFIDGLQWCDMV
jgi:hypothetical protein